MAMTPEQMEEFVRDAEKRQSETFARLLNAPAIRNALQQPAPGQGAVDDCGLRTFVRTQVRVTARCA